jgi:hypothetical protein
MSSNGRVWIEVPCVGTGAPDDPRRSLYPIEGNAFIVHQRGQVYVLFREESLLAEVETRPDCHRLTPKEVHTFESTLPFSLPPQIFNRDNRVGPVGLGDIVALLARSAGVRECGGCKRRKRWLNQFIVWGWWRS